MKLLIESGATKSSGVVFDNTTTFFEFKITGINATYATEEQIVDIFTPNFVPTCDLPPNPLKGALAAGKSPLGDLGVKKSPLGDLGVRDLGVIYYGAGCFREENAHKVKRALQVVFPNSKIEVYSDLLAVCHALTPNKQGFVGILGTGSASCYYDGKHISDKAPSLGFLLGDEGSGTYLGKQFLIKYLSQNINTYIAKNFEDHFSLTMNGVYEKLYRSNSPQPFLASIAPFLAQHIQHQEIEEIVKKSFRDFFDVHLQYYKSKEIPWHFCGSIAHYFKPTLLNLAAENGIVIENIVAECLPDLVKYYQQIKNQ